MGGGVGYIDQLGGGISAQLGGAVWLSPSCIMTQLEVQHGSVENATWISWSYGMAQLGVHHGPVECAAWLSWGFSLTQLGEQHGSVGVCSRLAQPGVRQESSI